MAVRNEHTADVQLWEYPAQLLFHTSSFWWQSLLIQHQHQYLLQIRWANIVWPSMFIGILHVKVSITLNNWAESNKIFFEIVSNLLVVCQTIHLLTSLLNLEFQHFRKSFPRFNNKASFNSFVYLPTESDSWLRIADLYARLSELLWENNWPNLGRPASFHKLSDIMAFSFKHDNSWDHQNLWKFTWCLGT